MEKEIERKWQSEEIEKRRTSREAGGEIGRVMMLLCPLLFVAHTSWFFMDHNNSRRTSQPPPAVCSSVCLCVCICMCVCVYYLFKCNSVPVCVYECMYPVCEFLNGCVRMCQDICKSVCVKEKERERACWVGGQLHGAFLHTPSASG